MSKQVYISADYSEIDGDREVVEKLKEWGADNKHKVDFIDMSEVKSGSVSKDYDCRICDLKKEFNSQINSSSAVIFVVGDKTKDRLAGSECLRNKKSKEKCECTPYKQNPNGRKCCKVDKTCDVGELDDVGNINQYSFLRHEFEQAKKKKKHIIIVYNSTRKEAEWLPTYMSGYEGQATPFWIKNEFEIKTGNYAYIKEELEDD